MNENYITDSVFNPLIFTQHKPEVAGAGREEVVGHGLLDGHPGVEEDREVAQLVGELLAEDGQTHRDAGQDGLREGGSWKRKCQF